MSTTSRIAAAIEKQQSLSVNERQAARADEEARRAVQPAPAAPGVNASLRVRALELANDQGETAATTVARAQQYYQFLTGEDSTHE